MPTSFPILIVDDQPQNLAAMRQVLDDYKLFFARSGEEALRMAAKHLPALILLDIDMPGMSGLDTCKQLRTMDGLRHTPIIFVSALTEGGAELAGFEAGGVDYIFKPISAPVVRARVKTHLSLVASERLERINRDAIYMLGVAGHYSDNDTGVHIWRMAEYAAVLAKAAGWSPERCNMLRMAAPMHDTGKIGIPASILKKPGKLDDEEWQIMRTHPKIGYDILSYSDEPVFQFAAEVALGHHERWDGTGYPRRLSADEIPQSARIVAIADVFDALTMKRPYKEAWSVERAVEVVGRDSGSHFDPELWRLFMSVIDEVVAVRDDWAEREQCDSPVPL